MRVARGQRVVITMSLGEADRLRQFIEGTSSYARDRGEEECLSALLEALDEDTRDEDLDDDTEEDDE